MTILMCIHVKNDWKVKDKNEKNGDILMFKNPLILLLYLLFLEKPVKPDLLVRSLLFSEITI